MKDDDGGFGKIKEQKKKELEIITIFLQTTQMTPMQAKGIKAKATQMKKSLAEFVANPFRKATLIAT